MRRRQADPLLLLLLVAAATVGATTPSAVQAAGTTQQPPPLPPEWCNLVPFEAASQPTAMAWGGNMLKCYRNLYRHSKRWYAVQPPGAADVDAGLSVNNLVVKLPVNDAAALQANLQVCYVPGVTLLVDFPFPAFPDNLGHWAELLLPLFSALSHPDWATVLRDTQHQHQQQHAPSSSTGAGSSDSKTSSSSSSSSSSSGPSSSAAAAVDRVLFTNVRPELLYNWPKELLALALAPALPPGSSSSSSGGAGTAAPWARPLPPLLGEAGLANWTAGGWVVFEAVVVAQDRYPILALPSRTLPQPPAAGEAAAEGQQHEQQQQQQQQEVGAGLQQQDAGQQGQQQQQQQHQQQQQLSLWRSPLQVGFSHPSLAAAFRAAAFARHMWGPPLWQQTGSSSSGARHRAQQQPPQGGGGGSGPGGGSVIPRVITVLLYPEDYPQVVNHAALVEMLEAVGAPHGFKVRTVSLTMGAPFLSHMATMSDTALLIGRHGPLLATAALLPPGAAVLELLPYKWEWKGVSRLYFNLTQSTGVLHHWAWRPTDVRWCRYKEPSHARYAAWTPSECHGRECLLVHAQAALEVDLEAVRALLTAKLPGLLAGASVEELAEPWPPSE